MVGDPLIADVPVSRALPLHESCGRLRELYPQCPRTYGVAVLADVHKRRWFPLESVLATDRLRVMYQSAAADMGPRVAGRLLVASFIHDVLGRVLPLVLLEGRAWDTGQENLWLHLDADGVIDWVAVIDPTLRVLPDDAALAYHADREAVVVLPNEAALTIWVAHRCHRTLAPLFAELHTVSARAVSLPAMWHCVGSAIVTAASALPQPTTVGKRVSIRRSQAMLDALVGFGLPVRGLPS